MQPQSGHAPHALRYSTRVRPYPDSGIIVVVLCVLVFGPLSPAAAQERSPVLTNEGHSLEPWEHEDHGWERGFKILGDDFLYLITSPLRPTVEGVLTAGAIGAAIGGFALLDRDIRDAAGNHRHDRLGEYADGIAQLGNAPVLFGLNVVGLLAGELTRQYSGDRTHLDAALATTEAQILAIVLSEGIGYATMRSTPRESRDPFTFKLGRSSFPSSHATQTFAVATVLADRYGWGVGTVAYAAATAVGAARILQERHWSSDVVAGAALGWFIGRIVSRRRSEDPPYLDFFPFADPGTRTYGFLMSTKF